MTAERLDVPKPKLVHPLLRLAQHRFGDVDAVQADIGRIVGQGDSGPHTDFEDTAADALRGGDGGVAAMLENRAENEVIDRRPSRISLGNRLFVEFRARNFRHRLTPWLFPDRVEASERERRLSHARLR